MGRMEMSVARKANHRDHRVKEREHREGRRGNANAGVSPLAMLGRDDGFVGGQSKSKCGGLSTRYARSR